MDTNQYQFKGKVIRGDGYGKKIGFPTLNIDRRHFSKLKKKPKYGVYSGEVKLLGKIYKSGIIIGPLDKSGLPKLEAHLMSYNGNAYGKKVEFKLKKFLREYKSFKTERELILQIKKDLMKCK
jgi:FAD synthase